MKFSSLMEVYTVPFLHELSTMNNNTKTNWFAIGRYQLSHDSLQ